MRKYPLALDAAPQDGRWISDPAIMKDVLLFLVSKLSPADRDELDAHLSDGTEPQATDHRIPPKLAPDLLRFTPRNRRELTRAGADIRKASRGPMTLDEMQRADPDAAKSFADRFSNADRLAR